MPKGGFVEFQREKLWWYSDKRVRDVAVPARIKWQVPCSLPLEFFLCTFSLQN